jgi:hypothetical protein
MAIRKWNDEPPSRFEIMKAWSERRKAAAQRMREQNETARNAMVNHINTQASNQVQLSEMILRSRMGGRVDKKA